ncbi:MAG: diacylglycerol/lipid kinase family protein [Gemmatimonadaceae bacterium]
MRTRKHFVFVIHGARADLPSVRHLVGWVREKGHHIQVRVTWEAGDGRTFAVEGAARGADAVVAVGGDGTVNEVVNGLAGSDVPLGIIPVGTANDFARQVGIPTSDPDHAMDVILRRKPRRIDTLELNGRRFLNVSTAGVGAETTAETPADAKAALGALAYAISGMRKLADLSPQRATFTAPGFELTGDFLVFAVGNARSTGGGTTITPRASVTDGLLDLCVVEAMPRREFVRLVQRMRRGEHLEDEGVHYRQLPWVQIVGDERITVNVDGETSELQRLDYRARPKDLLVHVKHLPGEAEA